ncbi:MAG: response regulator transcription factor [Verrucomicrobiota bacterium]
MISLQKVLLIDDEAHIRKYLSLVVRALGNPAVIEADNSEAGLAAYQAERPDLVLLDVNMPGSDGIVTLRGILAADPEANVVMVTSLANRQTIEQAIEAGALGYIRKDTERQEILSLLTSYLQPEA